MRDFTHQEWPGGRCPGRAMVRASTHPTACYGLLATACRRELRTDTWMNNESSFVAKMKLVLPIALVIAQVAFAEAPTKWSRQTQTSPMTDDQTELYFTDANSPVVCGSTVSEVRLYLHCSPKGPQALLGTTGCIFLEEHVFSYRVDDDPRAFVYSVPQESGRALHLVDLSDTEKRSTSFIRDIAGGSQLLIELQPVASQRAIVSFDMKGLREIAGPDFTSCMP